MASCPSVSHRVFYGAAGSIDHAPTRVALEFDLGHLLAACATLEPRLGCRSRHRTLERCLGCDPCRLASLSDDTRGSYHLRPCRCLPPEHPIRCGRVRLRRVYSGVFINCFSFTAAGLNPDGPPRASMARGHAG